MTTMDVNHVILAGRLTRDPELKQISTENSVCKFGIAITAMIKMIATTISNSIKEKPLSLRSPFPKVPSSRMMLNKLTMLNKL